MKIPTLILMAALHFLAMYFLMFAMVNTFGDIFLNLNNAYMAGLMTAPMLLIEGVLMKDMYQSKPLLYAVMGASAAVGLILFVFIRQQAMIGDREFLRSMIPHHSGAILMCEEANITDDELAALCESIIQSQQEEIDQMNAILSRMK